MSEFDEKSQKLLDLISTIDGEDKELLKDFKSWWMDRNDGIDRREYPNALPAEAVKNVDRMLDASNREVTMGGIDSMKLQLVQNIIIGQRIKSGTDVKKMKVKDMQAMIDAIGWSVFPEEWTLAPGEIIGYKEQ